MSDVTLRFGARDDGLTAQFRRVNASLDQFEKRAGQVAKNLQSLAPTIAGFFALREAVQFFNAATANAEAIDNLATRTGLTVQAVQTLQLAAEQSGIALEQTAESISKMQRALIQAEAGTGRQSAAFAALNLNIADIRNLAPEQQFETIARALANVQDKAEQTAIGTDLLGEQFGKQLPVILQAAEGFEAAAAGLEQIGGPLSDETIQKLDAVGDSAGLVGAAFKNLGSEALALVAVPLAAFFDGISTTLGAFKFAIAGGSNEIVNISDRIIELRDRADFLKTEIGSGGRIRTWLFGDKLNATFNEIDRLQLKLDNLLGVGFGLNPTLQAIGVDQTNAPNLNIAAPGGPRELTPSERRQKAQQEQQIALDAKLEQYEIEQVINQEHLDELLRQTSEYGAARVQIETDFQRLIAQSREQFGLEEINWEIIKSQSIVDIAGGLFSSLASQNQKFAKAQQAIALAQAIWYTASGVANALRSVPFPANIAAAAKVAAVGAIQIAKIKATRFDGGGGAASGAAAIGGGADAGGSSVPLNDTSQATAKQSATQVYINGVVTQQVVDQLLDGLRDSFDRDVVVIRGSTAQARELAAGLA